MAEAFAPFHRIAAIKPAVEQVCALKPFWYHRRSPESVAQAMLRLCQTLKIFSTLPNLPPPHRRRRQTLRSTVRSRTG